LDTVGWNIEKPKKEYRTIHDYKKYCTSLQNKLLKANLLATKVIHSSLDLCVELLEDSVDTIYEDFDYHQKGLVITDEEEEVNKNSVEPIQYLLPRLPGIYIYNII